MTKTYRISDLPKIYLPEIGGGVLIPADLQRKLLTREVHPSQIVIVPFADWYGKPITEAFADDEKESSLE